MMPLETHIGIYILVLLVLYGVYLKDRDWKNGVDWYVPATAATIFVVSFEIVYWVVTFVLYQIHKF